MKRSIFFIDGFNMYHALDADPALRRYKWLDFDALARCFSVRPYEDVHKVRYFTAYATWRPQSVERHKMYVRLLESKGVDVIFGRFQKKNRRCMAHGGCGMPFVSHEEKLTDVNIAVSILETCVKGECDILYLVSADNDLIPALDAAKRLRPDIDVTVLLPPNPRAKTMTVTCHENGYLVMKIRKPHLARSQFPDRVVLPDGKTFHRPPSWR